MRKLPKWLTPVLLLAILGGGILIANQFSVKPSIFAAGELHISEELLEDAKTINTLFLTVFDADSPMPMPYGAIRLKVSVESSGKFRPFVITPENLQIMNRDRPIPRKIRLKARLDRDGQGGMDQPGDLFGGLPSIPYGSEDVILTIDKKVGGE